MISWQDFEKIDIRTGTILSVDLFPEAIKPAYQLLIDFGELGIKKSERSSSLNESLNLPSLNINGIQSAAVGNLSANVIPTKAVASIDLRLVVGNDWRKQQQKVIAHIASKGYHVVYDEPTYRERLEYDKICMVHLS